MTSTLSAPTFTLAELHRSAKAILHNAPDAIVAYRLWRDVLRLAEDNPTVQLLKQSAPLDPAYPLLDSRWQYWNKVARQAFKSGSFRLEDEMGSAR